MNTSTLLEPSYDYRLVALSVVIAIVASYAALDLAGLVTANRDKARLAWLFGGAFAMGTGVWSMHYTGMLAYSLQVPVYYHVPTVILSLVAAIGAAFIALFVVSRERVSWLHIGAASLLMGAGIAAMHYTGMAAMRLPAMHHWDTSFVVLSVTEPKVSPTVVHRSSGTVGSLQVALCELMYVICGPSPISKSIRPEILWPYIPWIT